VPALVAGIRVFAVWSNRKAQMAGISPAMTAGDHAERRALAPFPTLWFSWRAPPARGAIGRWKMLP